MPDPEVRSVERTKDWWSVTGLTPAELPRVLVLEGTWWHRDREAERLRLLTGVRELKAPDWYHGWYRGVPIVYACMYGAARAVEPVAILGSLGVPIVFQIGSCGGISPQAKTGDLVVPTSVAVEEGVSRWYHPEPVVHPAQDLADAAAQIATARGFTVWRGQTVTEDTLMEVRPADDSLTRWLNAGYLGVDMETSAVLSAAKMTGMRAAAILYVWDELGRGRRWSDRLPARVELCRRAAEAAMFEIALEAGLQLAGDRSP
jgi:uridine phosphorylase